MLDLAPSAVLSLEPSYLANRKEGFSKTNEKYKIIQ